jgi:uncharacterized membrane protein YhaH (DUF805 family)
MIKRLFSVKGRSGRLEYFLLGAIPAFYVVSSFFLGIYLKLIPFKAKLFFICFVPGFILLLIMMYCAMVRRLHDLGYPAQAVWGFYPNQYHLTFVKGEPYTNQYGSPVGLKDDKY